jgi:hypothetical protein
MRAKERGLVTTECNLEQLEFHALSRREVDHRLGLLGRLADCFTDYRNPNSIEHSVHELVSQRVYGVALGYEDLDDHDVLRSDGYRATLCAG